MKPTVGRIVHFMDGQDVYAAMIVWVFTDTCVNLVVWNSSGKQLNAVQVEKSEKLDGYEAGKWQWPPRV